MLADQTQAKLFPTVIEYQPYAICNANCRYCPVGMLNREQGQKGEPIRAEVFEAMIVQTRGRRLERIAPHLNCEPLLYKNLHEQIRRWKVEHPEAKIEFSTNAVFLTENVYVQLAESGLDELQLHFMGISKEYHERAMQTNYERVKKNIETALTLKRQRKDSVILNIFSHRLAGASLKDWYEFAQEWKKKGAIVTLGPLWNRAGWYGEKFNEMSVGLRDNNPSYCVKPFRQIAIEHDGTVVLCSLDYDHRAKFGNIMQQPIEEIWNGPMLTYYRECHKDPNKLKDTVLCKDCIRGGHYLLDESILTKVVNSETSEGLSKEAMFNFLDTLDRF
mgnify:CR=1 FL=1